MRTGNNKTEDVRTYVTLWMMCVFYRHPKAAPNVIMLFFYALILLACINIPKQATDALFGWLGHGGGNVFLLWIVLNLVLLAVAVGATLGMRYTIDVSACDYVDKLRGRDTYAMTLKEAWHYVSHVFLMPRFIFVTVASLLFYLLVYWIW